MRQADEHEYFHSMKKPSRPRLTLHFDSRAFEKLAEHALCFVVRCALRRMIFVEREELSECQTC